MKLSIHDRFVLLSLLPGEGNFVTMGLVQELRRKVSVSAEDQDTIGFNPSTLQWSKEKERLLPGFLIELSQVETDIIVGALQKLDKDCRISVDHLRSYRRFVLGENVEENVDGS